MAFPKIPSATIKPMTISARYEHGVFKPLADVKLEEGSLAEVRVLAIADRLRGKPRSVRDFAFFGMWKDRTDIADSVKYVNKIRRDFRG